MKTLTLNGIFLTILTLVFCFSCTKDSVDDHGLTIEEYRQLGVPDPGKRWNMDDFVQAHDALAKLKWEKPYQLPMKDGEKSGALFSHMLSMDNMYFLKDDTLSLNAKAQLITEFLRVYNYWTDTYSHPAISNYYNREQLAIEIFNLNVMDNMVGLGVQILKSDDPTAVVLHYGVPSIKIQYLNCVQYNLGFHKEPVKYQKEDLEIMADSINASVIRNKVWMDSAVTAKLKEALNTAIKNTSSTSVREKYSSLEKSL